MGTETVKSTTHHPPPTIRILGIDPGIAATGWGVIDKAGEKLRLVEHGAIITSAGDAHHERLFHIYCQLLEVIDALKPDAAAVEELFGGVNIKTALSVGQARGVAVLACAGRGLAPHDYTPLRIKQAVAGYGRAGKGQVQQMVKALLGLARAPEPDHAADALAVAICHAHSAHPSAIVAARDRAVSGRRKDLAFPA